MLNFNITCWIDTCTTKAQAERVIGDKTHLIRTARTQEQYKKAIFDLAFYTQFTKATRPQDLKQEEVGYLVAWCVINRYDVTPKFVKPEW